MQTLREMKHITPFLMSVKPKKLLLVDIMTSKSLIAGLPIKMPRQKFLRKLYFFCGKDSWFSPRFICKRFFTLDKY